MAQGASLMETVHIVPVRPVPGYIVPVRPVPGYIARSILARITYTIIALKKASHALTPRWHDRFTQ